MATNQYTQNPFALLRISTQTQRQDVVKHGSELVEGTFDKERQNIYRKAIQQIITEPFERLAQTVWEMPDTDYAEHDETWRKFANAFQSNPTMSNNLKQLADTFIKENFHPDKLLALLSPLLKVSRPAEKHVFTFDPPANDDLHYPLNSSELF
jgi:hypothetical protein